MSALPLNEFFNKWHAGFLTLIVVMCHLFIHPVNAQKILSYGPKEPTASVHYNKFLDGIYKNWYKKQPRYPAKGAYSPSHYSDGSSGLTGSGVCNYIYIPTNGSLLPGHQYRLRLTIKYAKAYAEMPYFRSNFGVGLASDLFNNYFGLLSKHFVPLGIKHAADTVSIDLVFRPLCTSKYLMLGVFQGPEMDKQSCFGCQYSFELYNLVVEQYDDMQADFKYMCDAFEEKRLERKFTTGYDTDTVYFDSGSAAVQEKYLYVLDSIPSKLRTKQDLVSLYAYTDKEGNKNYELGAARSATVRDALVLRGIDTSRILIVNYGESRASNRILQKDRRVEIDVNRGKLFQKYYNEALEAAGRGDYEIAEVKIMKWLKMSPPDNAIYALFDCWGDGDKASLFRQDLIKNIKSRNYKGKALQFALDSLYCEDQKTRTLPMYLSMNRLPDFPIDCNDRMDSLVYVSHQSIVDSFYTKYGFPTVKEVGERGNETLPFMILHAEDTSFQNRYLPILKNACENEILSWEYYAMLYDKINIARNGRQRYGTQYAVDKNGLLSGLVPFEDESMVAEYRKQVGLIPLSDEPYMK